MITKFQKHLYLSVFAVTTFTAHNVHAAAFQLGLGDAGIIGQADAGSAVIQGDVAGMAYNPATMTSLNKHAVALSMVAISTSFRYSNQTATLPTFSPSPGVGPTNNGNDGLNGGGVSAVPAFYLMWNVNDRLKLGINMTVPYGLQTEYNSNWVGRYFAIKSELKTYNINPAMAYKFNDMVSFGAGVQVERIEATLSNAITSPNGLGGYTPDAIAEVKGSGWGFGGNFGLLLEPRKGTRFGIAYRSHIRHNVDGNVKIAGRDNLNRFAQPLLPGEGSKAETHVTLPETVTFSLAQDLNPRWTILGDLKYTHWGRFQRIDIKFPEGNSNGAAVANKTTQYGYNDSWFASVGAQYKATDKWLVKFGIAFDQTPTKTEYRDPRIPDESRMWYAAGLEYKTSEDLKFSLDYAYINVNEAQIDLKGPSVAGTRDIEGTLRGKFTSSAHLLGVRAHYLF